MKNYSKLFGAGTGMLVGQLLSAFIVPENAEAIGKALELALPLIAVYAFPANTPKVSDDFIGPRN